MSYLLMGSSVLVTTALGVSWEVALANTPTVGRALGGREEVVEGGGRRRWWREEVVEGGGGGGRRWWRDTNHKLKL